MLLELTKFDFKSNQIFSTRMEEYDRTLWTLQNMNGETVSPAMKVGIVWNRMGHSDLASHAVMNTVKGWQRMLMLCRKDQRVEPTNMPQQWETPDT